MQILVVPFLNLILIFYHLLSDNLGWAIVAVTVLVNLVLFPLNKKNIEMARKQQTLKPKLDELKKKYENNKTKLFEEQSKLLREEGINPAAGCLPAILQLVVLVILINAFSGVLSGNGDVVANLNEVAYHESLRIDAPENFSTTLFGYDLTERDVIPFHLPAALSRVTGLETIDLPGLLVVLAAFIQFVSARMMMPTVKKEEKLADDTATPTDDIASSMQKQMLILFPLMYLWFGTRYSSGLALYFLISSVFSVLRYSTISAKLDK